MTLPATLGILSVALVALMWGFQRRLIYFPDPGPVPRAGDVLPRAEDVRFQTDDGLTLNGWFVPAATGRALGALLVLNGNAGHRGHRAPLAEALAHRGFAVLLFDYRGYGGSPGRPTEEGLLRDARAARSYLEHRGDIAPIALFGESLGAAVALAVAAENAPAALILRSPFTSLSDVGRVHYPLLPVRLLLRDRYSSLERIRSLACPLLVVAGGGDRIIPAGQSRTLFDAAPVVAKRFVLVPGVDHNDPELADGEVLVSETARFLDEAFRRIWRQ
ncbi:MAG: alpha/beta hydrolase [Deltaproteobacteria bacterium]|nr:alpha/beta hydrolase [Deltaproteobacteria bacterium]